MTTVGPGLPPLAPSREEFAEVEISARAEDGRIMGLCHRCFPVEDVQRHAEAILTGQGKAVPKNLLAPPRTA